MSRTTSAGLALVAACALVAMLSQVGCARKQAPSQKGVPVHIVQVQKRDTARYLSNIASVQAFNMVTVRPQIDGRISRVAFKEGTDVKHGDVLVEIDRRPFDAQLRVSVAQRDRDVAQLENAKRDLARYQTLVDADAGSRQTLDTTHALVDQLSAAIEMDVAQVEIAKLQLSYATITAPIDGRTGARLVDVGNIVHASETTGLVVLTQIHPIAVTFSLPQVLLPQVRQQQARRPLRVLAMDAAGEQTLESGELTLIDNQIEPATGTFRCKAIFANADTRLWPGQFITARLLLENRPEALVVPTSAVQEGPHGPYLYVVDDAGRAKLHEVAVEPAGAGEVAIVRGLAGGERVVTEGQFQLEPGALVDIREAPGSVKTAK